MTSTARPAETPSRAAIEAPVTSRRSRLARSVLGSAPIFLVLLVVLVLVGLRAPQGPTITYYLRLLQEAAPLMVLAAGQTYVIVSGEFDLSVGAVVSTVVVAAAVLTAGNPAATPMVIAILFAFGVLVGLANGLITTRLRVPSFIATLGMAFIVNGLVLLWTRGSPRGSLPPNLRMFGREVIRDVPLLGTLPYAVPVLLVVGFLAYWLLRNTNFGRQVFAVGGNARAAALSGVDVARVRTFAFVLSGVSAIIAGILLAGFGGLANRAGEGYEFQAISAVVLGGAALGGGRGSLLASMAGALTLVALFRLLLLLALPQELRFALQGVIIVVAVAFAAYRLRRAG